MQVTAWVCPDCKSKELIKKTSERITSRLIRSYWDCQCCQARIRVLNEGPKVTDIAVTVPNLSAVNLVLLAIDRMTRNEQTQLMQALNQLQL